MDILKFEKNWAKWEPILLYLFFAVRFYLAAFFWIMPQFIVLAMTLSEFYYFIFLTLGLFPLLINLRGYVIVSPERRIFYRISKFLSNLMFGAISYIMNLPLSPFSYGLIVVLLTTLIMTMMIIDKIISQKTFFYLSKKMIILFIISIILSFLLPNSFMPYPEFFFIIIIVIMIFMMYNVIDSLVTFIEFKK